VWFSSAICSRYASTAVSIKFDPYAIIEG
jgi:hypothetical protein